MNAQGSYVGMYVRVWRTLETEVNRTRSLMQIHHFLSCSLHSSCAVTRQNRACIRPRAIGKACKHKTNRCRRDSLRISSRSLASVLCAKQPCIRTSDHLIQCSRAKLESLVYILPGSLCTVLDHCPAVRTLFLEEHNRCKASSRHDALEHA